MKTKIIKENPYWQEKNSKMMKLGEELMEKRTFHNKNLKIILHLIIILIIVGNPTIGIALDGNRISTPGAIAIKAADGWAQEEIAKAWSAGMIPHSIADGEIVPQYTKGAKRSDFCAIIIHLIEKTTNKTIETVLKERGISLKEQANQEIFKDTKDPNIIAAAALGIVNGYDGYFEPGVIVSRREAATMLYRTAQVLDCHGPNGKPSYFSDVWQMEAWAKDPVKFVSGQRETTGKAVMSGYQGAFSPQNTYTLQETLITVWRLYDSLQNKAVYEGWRELADWNSVEIVLSAAGDCTFGRNEGSPYALSFDAVYDKQKNPAYFFQHVREFQEDDISIVNFEGALTSGNPTLKKEFRFKGAAKYAEILDKGSVEVVNIANNHSKDYGEKGYQETVTALRKYVEVTGYQQLPIVEVKGVKIGFLGNKSWAYDQSQKNFVINSVKQLKERGAQIIVANFHWGEEMKYKSNTAQQQLARFCIDNGVDLVLGHHPHVLQEVETYKGKQIAYSLGNFVYGGHRNPKDKNTMVFQQKFLISLDSGQILKSQYEAIPYSISSINNANNYQPIRR